MELPKTDTLHYLRQHMMTYKMSKTVIIFLLIFSNSVLATELPALHTNDTSSIDRSIVFEPIEGQYSSMRIPALVMTKKGTLLAFAAGRIESGSDWADMDLVMKRSEDGGQTWGPLQVVAE